ncbi:MAG: DNA (cytosine-5-)-methyltransferase [Lachnospiraceae bacterium]
MRKTVCELFAGVGGFRVGLEKSSKEWDTVWFSQWEPGRKSQWAHECYVSHFGDIDSNTNRNISTVNKQTVPEHSLLVGGFPCQNYSVAASKSSKGIEGEKGVLWWEIRDLLIAKKAPFVLLENVDRLLKSPAVQRGRDFGVMLTCFAQLGYRVEWRVINAAEYGAAQRRRRIFIFAYKNDTKYANCMDEINSKEMIHSEGFFASTFPVDADNKMKETEVPYHDMTTIDSEVFLTEGEETGDNDLLSVSKEYQFAFENAGYMKDGKIYTCKVDAIVEEPILLKDIIIQGAEEQYTIPEDKLEKWVYLKGAKRINRTSKNGHAYVFSEGPVAFPDSLDKPSRTMLTSESSINRSSHAIKDPVTDKIRLITPVEAERLQGFADDWTNTGMPQKFRYFCMGNALVVPMVARMGKTLNKIIEAED